MITFCTKCGINWARLYSQDDEGEESYECCPVCNTDRYLADGNDITGFIMNPITGQIVNADTGEEYNRPYVKPRIRIRLQRPKPERLRPKWEVWEEREDMALEEYFKTGNDQSFFESFKQTKNLQ